MKYKILHLEDSVSDADIVKRVLHKSGLDFYYRLATTKEDLEKELSTFAPDIVLCDHSLPSFNSKKAFTLCKENNIDLPFVLVTGTVSEEFAVEMLKLGADDYLLKTNLQRLPSAVINALSKSETYKKVKSYRLELNKSEVHLRTIFENSSNGLLLVDKNFTVIEFNNIMAKFTTIFLGRPYKKNQNILEALPPERREKLKADFENKIFKGIPVSYESVYTLEDGTSINLWVLINPVKDIAGKIEGGCISITDVTEQKKSEQLIKQSEERYRDLIEQASDAILTFSFDGTIYQFNKACYTMLGYSKEQYAKLRLCDILVDDIIVDQVNYAAILAGETKTLNRTLMHKDGSLLETEVAVKILTDGKAIAFARDITERKKAENEVKSLARRLQLATTSADMGIWDWNIKSNELIWDEKMCSLYKIDSLNFGSVYQEWISMLHPDDRERVNEEIQMAVTGKELYDTEFRVLWDGQSVRYIRATGILEVDASGNAIRMIGLNWDITSQKEKERHLKLLESVITNTKDSVVITEAEPFDEPGHKIVYVNEAFTKMTGYSAEEVIGKSPRILQGPKSDKAELKRFGESIRKWKTTEITTINYKKNGEEFWVNFSVSPVANENGWYTHWIAIERDVTEQKLVEMQLKELNDNLKKQAKELAISNAELEQFAYVASHDLQEPLRMVTSFLTQLEKRYGDAIDEKAKKYIAFAVDGAKRMRQIILDLLEYSRVGTTDDDKEALDLNELLNEIKILFRKNIEEQKAVIKIDTLPTLHGHLSPLRQVFQNLVGNALKYSSKESQPQIHITVKELKDHWQFAVIDNGIGIGKEYFDKIFIIFQRLHNKDEYSGTGMGLAITKKIIERLGGKIWVESEEGKGSTFYFTLLKTT